MPATHGASTAVVVATGGRTEFGAISGLLRRSTDLDTHADACPRPDRPGPQHRRCRSRRGHARDRHGSCGGCRRRAAGTSAPRERSVCNRARRRRHPGGTGEPGAMRRPPRDPQKPVLSRGVVLRTTYTAVLMTAAATGLFAWEYFTELESGRAPAVALAEARTMAVTTVVGFQVFYVLHCRSLTGGLGSAGWSSNPYLYAGIGALAALQLALIYAPPLNAVFETAPLGVGSAVVGWRGCARTACGRTRKGLVPERRSGLIGERWRSVVGAFVNRGPPPPRRAWRGVSCGRRAGWPPRTPPPPPRQSSTRSTTR